MASTKTLYHCFYILLLLILCNPAYSQDYRSKIKIKSQGIDSPKANINQVEWITGKWEGKALGGIVEENWSTPMGGAMMGNFRLINKSVSFYEIMIIREFESSLQLRLKHFNADLTGWEEKNQTVDFPLIELTDSMAYFDGLTFELLDDQHLNVYVVLDQEGDVLKIEKFAYTLKN